MSVWVGGNITLIEYLVSITHLYELFLIFLKISLLGNVDIIPLYR